MMRLHLAALALLHHPLHRGTCTGLAQSQDTHTARTSLHGTCDRSLAAACLQVHRLQRQQQPCSAMYPGHAHEPPAAARQRRQHSSSLTSGSSLCSRSALRPHGPDHQQEHIRPERHVPRPVRAGGALLEGCAARHYVTGQQPLCTVHGAHCLSLMCTCSQSFVRRRAACASALRSVSV
jgi:hypothetical protein